VRLAYRDGDRTKQEQRDVVIEAGLPEARRARGDHRPGHEVAVGVDHG
jgi:hypothetical protein